MARRRQRRPSWLPFLVVLGPFVGAAGWLVTTGWPVSHNLGLVGEADLAPSAADPAFLGDATPQPLVVPAPTVPNSSNEKRLAPTRSPLAFADVPEGYWAKPYIDALTAREVLNGLPDGTFAPNRQLSRAELATQVANAFDIPANTPAKAFGDLAPDYWAAEPIAEAVQMGFMKGYPGDEFRPDDLVSRLQVLVTLATGLSLPVTEESQQQLQQYQDWETVPDWARPQVEAAIHAGIIRPQPGTENRLRPQEIATRAEVATLVYAALAYLGEVPAKPE
ncbi:S-layer homology domain-containing protein [Leptolyngbya iicbica LK]|uniref:S-layer homology domain-containing protein n=2 Tax=Cyanophyceae TaxID=3028117 RepID=A0A4Q7E5P0_9CYAN|nr:S-layer homology domain-containing protein [Leptolyngbya sp. LK]